MTTSSKKALQWVWVGNNATLSVEGEQPGLTAFAWLGWLEDKRKWYVNALGSTVAFDGPIPGTPTFNASSVERMAERAALDALRTFAALLMRRLRYYVIRRVSK